MNSAGNKARLFSFKYFVFDIFKVTGALPTLLLLRPKRIYANQAARQKIRGGALLISNHSGFLDPVYMLTAVWYRRQRFICSEELMRSRAGKMLKAVGCIEIDRQNPTLGSFRQITSILKNGEMVSMFPEGHISADDGKINSFKSGMVLMAIRGGVPIVPMYIQPRKHFFSRLKVVIGEKVSVAELYGERPAFVQIDEAARLLYRREEALKEALR